MDLPLFDDTAPKTTIELTLNGDLYAKAKAAEINVSHTTEEALIRALRARERDRIVDDIRRGSEAVARYVEEHGDPVAEWNEMFGDPHAA